jgi:hypothetical protein
MTESAPEQQLHAASRRVRTARCSCGELRIELRGEPSSVYACSCLECQRATGSAFAYRAWFDRSAVVTQKGATKVYRRNSDAGRWVDSTICPECGTLVFVEGEGKSGCIAVSVGCMDDTGRWRPTMLYHATRRHTWIDAIAELPFVS